MKARIAVLFGFLTMCAVVIGANLMSLPEAVPTAADMPFLQKDLEALEQDKITLQRMEVALEYARLQDKQQAIPVWRHIKYGAAIGISCAVMLSTLLLAGAYRRKLLTHIFRLKEAEVPIKDEDLSKFTPEISTGLVLAAQLESQAPEKAFEMYLSMAQVNTRQLQALTGRRGIPGQIDPIQAQSALPAAPTPIPTFAELLQRQDIAPGRPLLFGLEDSGHPKHGTWQDLYSSAIAGQSGNGKSSTARSLILQSLLSGEIDAFYLTDPHRHKRDGLINTLGPIVSLPNVFYNETNFDLHAPIQAFAERLDARVAGQESCLKPIVLVIDELLVVIKNVPEAADIVRRIGTEGRGFNCFGLFLAHSWVGKEVGGTSTRDNLTSLLVHRLKRKQASTLLQNAEWAKVASELDRGDIVFEPTSEEPYKLHVPLCTPADAISVYQMLTDGNTVKISGDIDGYFQSVSQDIQPVNVEGNKVNHEVNDEVNVPGVNQEVNRVVNLRELDDSGVVNHLVHCLEKGTFSQARIAKLTGVSTAFISQLKAGKKTLSPRMREKLLQILQPNTNVVHLDDHRNQ